MIINKAYEKQGVALTELQRQALYTEYKKHITLGYTFMHVSAAVCSVTGNSSICVILTKDGQDYAKTCFIGKRGAITRTDNNKQGYNTIEANCFWNGSEHTNKI